MAIRYMGREKDDVLTATVSRDEATRIRGDFSESIGKTDSVKAFVVVEAEDKKTFMIRRDSILSVVVWEERDR
jgi:hypothetical protein